MPTVMTAFGRGVELVDLDEGSSVPLGFVFQLADELTPAHITDGFSKAVVLHHILDLQAFNAYDLVLAYDGGRELVLIVTMPISYPSVDFGNFLACLSSVLRACFLPGQCALSTGQSLLIGGCELGIAVRVPIGGDDHRLETQVQADHLGGDIQRLDIFFYEEGDKIAASRIFGDGNTGQLGFLRQRARPDNLEWFFHLGQGECLAVPFESRGHSSTLCLEAGVLRGGSITLLC